MQNDTPEQNPVVPSTSPAAPPVPPTTPAQDPLSSAPSTPPSTPPKPFGGPIDNGMGSAQPATAGTPPQPPMMAGSPAPMPQSPKSKKPLIIIAIIVALLVIGGIVAAVMLGGKGTSEYGATTKGAKEARTLAPAEKEAIVAASSSDLSKVCEGKKLSNAPAITTPVKLAPFVQGYDSWNPYIYSNQQDNHLSLKVEEVSVVACAYPDASTYTEAKVCEAKDSTTDAPITLQYKGAEYDLVFYNAQTGEKMSEAKLTSDNSTCPLYSVKGGEYIAIPIGTEVTGAFNAFYKANP